MFGIVWIPSPGGIYCKTLSDVVHLSTNMHYSPWQQSSCRAQRLALNISSGLGSRLRVQQVAHSPSHFDAGSDTYQHGSCSSLEKDCPSNALKCACDLGRRTLLPELIS